MQEDLEKVIKHDDSPHYKRPGKVDKYLLWLIAAIVFIGILIFTSASLGLLARSDSGPGNVIFSQLVLGLGIGLVLGYITFKIPYVYFRKLSFWIFLLSVLASFLVFTKLGFEFAGARRWLALGSFSFQPAEFLKFGFILFFSSWLAVIKDDIKTIRYGVIPIAVILFVVALPLLLQPDHGTFLAIFGAAVAMIIVAGIRWRDLLVFVLVAMLILLVIAFFKPYVMQRITTFINPNSDPLGASYQLRQSLIAVGSGGTFGNGFGQSIQKFTYLPEPVGDSIFAVFAEEFGFAGSVLLIGLYITLLWRGFKLAKRSTDPFITILFVGFFILIVAQSFLNIAAMIGLFPLTGIPLVFISHGGTALMFTLIEMGLILQLTKYIK